MKTFTIILVLVLASCGSTSNFILNEDGGAGSDSDVDSDSGVDGGADSETEEASDPATETEEATDSATEAATDTATNTGSVTDSDTEAETDSDTDSASETDSAADTDSVTESEIVACDKGTFVGDLTLSSENKDALRGYTEIQGNLMTTVSDAEVSCLARVDGDFSCTGSWACGMVEWSSLEEVTGKAWLWGGDEDYAHYPVLRTVHDVVLFLMNAYGEGASVTSLAGLENLEITGDFTIDFARMFYDFSTVDFSALENWTSIGGTVTLVDYRDDTYDVSFSSLTTIGGGLKLDNARGSIPFPALTEVGTYDGVHSFTVDIGAFIYACDVWEFMQQAGIALEEFEYDSSTMLRHDECSDTFFGTP